MNILKSLWDRTPFGRIATLERRMAGLSVCPSCGTVIVPGHPGTRQVTALDGTVIALCKWDHARLKDHAKPRVKN